MPEVWAIICEGITASAVTGTRDTWHLDEVLLTINKEYHDLWQAGDQDGHVLNILVQRRQDKIMVTV
jgi:transposase-like protein